MKWKRDCLYLALFLMFQGFVFQEFRVPSGSMIPNLSIGDEIVVAKYAYGYSSYSWPVPFTSINFIHGYYSMGEPQRGDVVTFRNPKDVSQTYVKRLIGLPGDTIQVKRGDVYVNGVMLREEPESDEDNKRDKKKNYGSYLPGHWQFYHETSKTNGTSVTYKVLRLNEGNGPVNNTDIYKVPEGHYFMMGDNRDDSYDSRFKDGIAMVPRQNIIGRVVRVAYSFEPSTLPLPLSLITLPLRFRWGKVFASVNE